MAVQLGFLTRDIVEEARGKLPPDSAFDEHLLSLKLLTLEQIGEIHEQIAPKENQPLLFGEILVREGWVSPEGIEEGLRVQKEMVESGQFKRIGEILEESDVLTPDIIMQVLKIQGKTLMTCRGCRSHFNVVGFRPGRRYRCQHCKMLMVPGSNNILVDETVDARGDTPRVQEEGPRTKTEHFGKFRLDQLLGSKQMRPVYRAVQESMDRVVALHLLSREEAEQVEIPGDFYHPRIISILETGIHEETAFVATEFVAGKTLDEFKVGTKEGIEMIRDIARALYQAHEKGLAHGNIHPRNIIKGDDGNVWLMNFGLPAHPHKTAALSPEQERGGKGTGRSDIWSLAATLRLLLDVPPELEVVLHNAMRPDPKKRYENAGAFADDLERVLRGEEVQSRSWSLGKKILFAVVAGVLIMSAMIAYSFLTA